MKYARNGQILRAHLVGTATKTASRMPNKWKNIGYYAGLWHDLGKYTDEWQAYLQKCIAGEKPRKVPHSPQGARLALSLCKRVLQVPALTFVIAGHHGGLKDISNYQGDEFKEKAKNWEKAKSTAIKEIENFIPPELPEFDVQGTRREFAIRMLFGCLVDADRVDAVIATENAPPDFDEASALSGLFTCFNPRHRNPNGALASIRLEFRNDCIAQAANPCGIFRLTGPTGIGKTLSSLEWAIAHCQANSSLTGILYVAPLRSIIDQTWQVYSQNLSVKVLAHHSDFQPNQEEASDYKLTTERWNAPVICTSGVQFYESLFARTPAQCRKLSHLMNRCILIDEAQTIPLEYAKPILDVLLCLMKDWGCSILLMSATQPTFKNIDANFDNRCIDIISDDKVNYYFNENYLVKYKVSLEQWGWQDLADKIKDNNQSLTIVNTTKLAQEGFIALSELVGGKWFHLSARMVPAHRKQVLAEINHHLDHKLPCHVISTQVVEAGIDIDFPVVFRQIAPLDSIIQAAGRCNRENERQECGVVQVFELADSNYPSTEYKTRTNITKNILNKCDLNTGILDAINEYFLVAYSQLTGDRHNVQQLRRDLKFEQVSSAFKIIDDDYQFSVFVPWQEGEHLLNSLALDKALTEEEWRSLQPYTINLPKSLEKDAHKYPCGLYVWSRGMYNDGFGAISEIESIVV